MKKIKKKSKTTEKMRKLEGQRMKKGAQKKEDGDKELEPHAPCETTEFWSTKQIEI